MIRSLATHTMASRGSTFRFFSTSSTTSSFQHLIVEQKGPVLWITMNRPDVHNAFNEDVIDELTRSFREASATISSHAATHPVADSSASVPRVVVLAGNGASFSAGADLNWMAKMAKYSKAENETDSHALFDMFHAIYSCPVPVVARVHGAALGGGSGLVAACDISLALDKAKLGFTEVGLGLIPAVISRFCIDKIGVSHASRYFVTGERFSGSEAVRIGLCQQSFATTEELDAAVDKLTATIAGNSPNAVRAAKQLVRDVTNKGLSLDKPETKAFTCNAIASIRVSEEGQAGLHAFLNKAPAPWTLKK